MSTLIYPIDYSGGLIKTDEGPLTLRYLATFIVSLLWQCVPYVLCVLGHDALSCWKTIRFVTNPVITVVLA